MSLGSSCLLSEERDGARRNERLHRDNEAIANYHSIAFHSHCCF